MIKLLKQYPISILILITILILCTMKMSSFPAVEITNFDKLVHLTMGGGFCGCLFFEQSRYFRRKCSTKNIFWGCCFISLCYGGLIEILQEYFTYRTGDYYDFLFNGVGAFLAFSICLIINKRLPEKK